MEFIESSNPVELVGTWEWTASFSRTGKLLLTSGLSRHQVLAYHLAADGSGVRASGAEPEAMRWCVSDGRLTMKSSISESSEKIVHLDSNLVVLSGGKRSMGVCFVFERAAESAPIAAPAALSLQKSPPSPSQSALSASQTASHH